LLPKHCSKKETQKTEENHNHFSENFFDFDLNVSVASEHVEDRESVIEYWFDA